jgi:GH15 family glucan-1,4-alpha-glucosidase
MEYEVPWLSGYDGSAPVRIGNAASGQFQLDVFGEVMDTLQVARRVGLEESASAWDLQRALIDHLEGVWREPDDGIWEVRGPRRHFVHSKVMAWVAADRAVKAVEGGRTGDPTRWRRLRAEIHDEVTREGFDAERQTFTQYYGSTQLDAALLLLPQVGFLPPTDPRILGTIAAIEHDLYRDGLVMRYDSTTDVDGLPSGEGSFLPCSFWLVDAWAMCGRRADALALFHRLLTFRSDLGLLSEEYDTARGRQVGNVPQAFSHLSLVNSAHNLADGQPGVASHRSSTS